MKFSLIFKEKRKKNYFFILLKYFLNTISSFDFADFQLLEFFKNINILNKLLYINYTKIFIFMQIFANYKKDYYIISKLKKNYHYIKKLNILNFLQLCLLYEKNINLLLYKYKIPIFNIIIFFWLLFEKTYIRLNNLYIFLFKKYFININKNWVIFINFFNEHLYLQKNVIQQFSNRHIRIYIYFFIKKKLLKNFKYSLKNLYNIKSSLSKNILHSNMQEIINDEIIKDYLININMKK